MLGQMLFNNFFRSTNRELDNHFIALSNRSVMILQSRLIACISSFDLRSILGLTLFFPFNQSSIEAFTFCFFNIVLFFRLPFLSFVIYSCLCFLKQLFFLSFILL